MAKKRKTGGLSGEEKQARRRERLEARREAKAEAQARRRRVQQRERLVRMAMLALLVFGAFWFFFLRNRAPSEINGHEIQTVSATGVGDHISGTVNYETSPPVSGQHAPTAIPCGTYAETIPNETQVHMLEHGAVGVQYQPDVDPAEIAQIEEIVSSYSSHVFSAPYTQMENPIALTSWSRLMRLDELEEDSIRQYIDEFRREGPEPNQPCEMDADDSFESPQASPSPDQSPEDDDGDGGTGNNG